VPGHLRLVRAGNVAVSLVGTVVGGLAARGVGGWWWGTGAPIDIPFLLALVLAGASTAFVTAGGNVLNDLGDRDSDRVNHPDRPLVTGAISVPTARRLAVALFVLAIVAIVPIAWSAPLVAVILATALAALLAYEWRYKAAGLPGNLLVAFLTAEVFLYGGAVAGNLLPILPFALMAFGATLSRELIKDMEDAEGDVGRATLPRTRGMGTAGAAARVSVGLAIALSPVPVLSYLSPTTAAGIMYIVLVLAADALFVVSVLWLPKALHREQTLSKGAMTVALLAFLAVAFR
jgi:geranylgeranylglycerol-phosphate geranylgeranyltransferase